MARTRRKKVSTNVKKVVLTSVIGSLALLGVASAGYVTWSAMANSSSVAESAGKSPLGNKAQARQSLRESNKNKKRNVTSKTKRKVASQKKARKKVKQSASCKVEKRAVKAKVASHKKSKHNRKKFRHSH